MAPLVELLSRNNPVFSAYVFYSTILLLKMLAMSLLTARQRMRKRVRNVAITSSVHLCSLYFIKYSRFGRKLDRVTVSWSDTAELLAVPVFVNTGRPNAYYRNYDDSGLLSNADASPPGLTHVTQLNTTVTGRFGVTSHCKKYAGYVFLNLKFVYTYIAIVFMKKLRAD
jgi:hypothetical protein